MVPENLGPGFWVDRSLLGEKLKKLFSGLSVLVISAALLAIPAQTASANSYSADGIDFSWKTPFLPAKYQCRDLTVNFTNNGTVAYGRVYVSILNKFGDKLGEALAPNVESGESGVLRVQYCDKLLHGTKGYQFEVVTRTFDYTTAVSVGKFKFKKRR